MNDLEDAVKNGLDNVVYYTVNEKPYDDLLYYACKYNRVDLINYAIKKGAKDFNRALYTAAKYNNIDAFKIMSFTEADNYECALLVASIKGYTDIVNIIVENNETNFECNYVDAIYAATENNNIEIVKILSKYIIMHKEYDAFNTCSFIAAEKNNADILKLMIEYGANHFDVIAEYAEKK